MERLLWEFHLLSLCRRPLELLRGEELHWSCSKKVNAKPTTRTRATGFTLHQKTLPLTLRNCRTHPSGISNVKYTQRNHSAAKTDGLLTLSSVRTDRTREKKKKKHPPSPLPLCRAMHHAGPRSSNAPTAGGRRGSALCLTVLSLRLPR